MNDRQNDWDIRLPHVEFACNNSVSAAAGLAPNEFHRAGYRVSQSPCLNWATRLVIRALNAIGLLTVLRSKDVNFVHTGWFVNMT